jgi:hypothetical protein
LIIDNSPEVFGGTNIVTAVIINNQLSIINKTVAVRVA